MEYRQLGSSSLSISRIGFGCMSLKSDQQDAVYLLHEAMDAGINYFDTADLYERGWNEELVGKAFSGRRDRVVMATKAGNQWRADGSGWDWNPGKKHILNAVEESLRRLNTPYIDLYQLHGGTMEDPVDETVEAFELLVKSGKIRHYGISSIRPAVIRYWAGHSNIVSVMLQYSLLDRRPEESVLPWLQEKGIGVLVRGSIAQGLLAGKPAKENLGHSSSFVREAAAHLLRLVPDQQLAAAAIGYTLAHPAVTSAVVGIRTREQLNEAITARSVSPGQYTELQKSVPPAFYKEHR
jgi:aryl-alcohol dehydrogenase-like predicted oxidoreductase